MRKIFFLFVLSLLTAMPVTAEDVRYITTEQFRERIFD